MTYEYKITIRPCVNFSTHSAEVYITNEEYNGSGKGIVVGQKHIASCATNEEAMAKTEEYCKSLRIQLEDFVKAETCRLANAKP